MEKKLRSGEYKSPWGYIDDFRLMLDNCATYNKKSTQVYKDSVTVRYEGLLCNRLETFIILNPPVFISLIVRAFLIGFRQRLVFSSLHVSARRALRQTYRCDHDSYAVLLRQTSKFSC
jgi:hypothetical protein